MANDREKPIPDTGREAGRDVETDARGRNVWHWNGEQLDSTTIMLSRLDNDALELEPTRSVPIPGGERDRPRGEDDGEPDIEATLDVGVRAGFDPYNRS